MMFTTTIRVSSIYVASRIVIVPMVWLYMMVVVVVTSLSIIILCSFISLLLVVSGIMYVKIGIIITIAAITLFDGENISFEASLVMYMNKTSIPPTMIMNRMYENQNLLYIVPLIRHTSIVWASNIIPIAMGCFIWVNVILVIILADISAFVMSGGILLKMLILGINEMEFCSLSSEVLKGYYLFLVYKTNIFIKLLKLLLFNVDVDVFFCYLPLWCLSFLFQSKAFAGYLAKIGVHCLGSLFFRLFLFVWF